jgi:putative methyltransferase
VHRRENEDVVASAIAAAAEAGFELVDAFPPAAWPRRGLPGSLPGGGEARVVRTDAAEDGTDGFFVAVFERRRTSSSGGGGAGHAGDDAGGGVQQPAGGVSEAKKNKKKKKKP